ncbi:MAG: redoxin domain-containing protein [Bacteroidales bacterium]|nr:redoxin domain-containing protein [Bacteroidales bacterium]
MKRLLYLFIGLLFFTACDISDQFIIEGNIENGQEKEITLSELLVNGTKEIKTVKIDKDGNFKIKSSTNLPRFYHLSVSKSNFLTLLIEPGEKLKVKTEIKNLSKAQIKGSEGSILVQDINNQLFETKQQLKEINKKAESLKNPTQEELNKLNANYANIVNQQRDSSIAFIVRNLNSLASIVALYQKYDDVNYVLYKNKDIQYVKIVSESLIKKYPESEHVKTLIADKENLMAKYNEVVLNSQVNNIVGEQGRVINLPEIFLPNSKGDSISFTKTKGKYILLSFWAAWNEDCTKRNLVLKDVYKKYHSKGFEIYQVSLDTKIENWEKAIKFDQLPWINVIDQNGRMSYYAKIYNIRKLPTSFLINPSGEIAFVNPSKEQLLSTFKYSLK